MRRSASEGMNDKNVVKASDNAFDVLRLIGAFIVIFSHSCRHMGVEKPFWSVYFTNGAVGVMVFFAITGFVIMPAWERARKKKHPYLSFWLNRILRIYPGLILSFILITVIDSLVIGEKIFTKEFLVYVVKYCFLARGDRYGLNGLTNGVLWVIIPDIVYYALTPLIWKLMHNRKTWIWILIIFIFWQFNIFDTQIIGFFGRIPFIGRFIGEDFFLCLFYEFLIGSFLYFKKDTIIAFFIRRKWVAWVLFAAFSVFFEIYTYFDVIPPKGVMHSPWIGILMPFFAIILGFALGKIHLKIDISYGLFLNHMIVIGTLLYLGIKGLKGMALVILITPLIAVFSLLFVEKPALRMKNLLK